MSSITIRVWGKIKSLGHGYLVKEMEDEPNWMNEEIMGGETKTNQ